MEATRLPVQAGFLADHANELPVVRIEAFKRVEDYFDAYLDDERFKVAYPLASEGWSEARAMLWRADSKAKVIVVGRRAREVMQEFASALLDWQEPRTADQDSNTSDRLSAVIEMYRPHLGDSRCEFLESLCTYWWALNDVVQRHELGVAHKLSERLKWEDGRRLVVLTALVMVEIDRSLWASSGGIRVRRLSQRVPSPA
jgi:hypothetical protein